MTAGWQDEEEWIVTAGWQDEEEWIVTAGWHGEEEGIVHIVGWHLDMVFGCR